MVGAYKTERYRGFKKTASILETGGDCRHISRARHFLGLTSKCQHHVKDTPKSNQTLRLKNERPLEKCASVMPFANITPRTGKTYERKKRHGKRS